MAARGAGSAVTTWVMARRADAESGSIGRRLALATGVLLTVRVVLALVRPGPILLSDEVGYLTNARVLSGGAGADLLQTSFYEAGYSLLLAPVVGLVHDPVAAYRLVIVVNALLGASLVPLLYLLLTRGFDIASRRAIWPAIAGACYPSVTLTAGAALGENLLYPLAVAWLLCLALLIRARTPIAATGWAAATALAACALWSTHGRMLVAVVISGGVIAAVASCRPRLRVAAAGLVVLTLGLVLAHRLTSVVIDRNYGGRDFTMAVLNPSTIGDPNRLLLSARNLIGHTWYLFAASLGVVPAFLLSGEVRRSLARVTQRRAASADVLLMLLLLTVAGLLVASALTFGHAHRADRLIFGRYTEIMAPPLLAVALSFLVAGPSPPRPGPVAALLLSLTAVIVVMRLGLDVREAVNTVGVGSFPFRTGDLGPLRLLGAGIVAACVAWLALTALRHGSDGAPLVVIAVFALVTVSALQPLLYRTGSVYPPGWRNIGEALSGSGVATVGYDEDGDIDPSDREGGLIYPWFLRDAVLVRFSACKQPPPARYVVSTADWPARHPARPARVVWTDPVRDRTLWALRPAGSSQEAAARSASALPCRS